MDSNQKGGIGQVIAIVIIVLILAVGGVYFWMMKTAPSNTVQNPANNNKAKTVPSNNPTATNAALKNQLDASAGASLDSDINNINQSLAK